MRLLLFAEVVEHNDHALSTALVPCAVSLSPRIFVCLILDFRVLEPWRHLTARMRYLGVVHKPCLVFLLLESCENIDLWNVVNP